MNKPRIAVEIERKELLALVAFWQAEARAYELVGQKEKARWAHERANRLGDLTHEV